jgi:hypothetical protein
VGDVVRGVRRAFWSDTGIYVGVAGLYVGLGVLLNSVVLNWLVGPALFVAAITYLVPRRHHRGRQRCTK